MFRRKPKEEDTEEERSIKLKGRSLDEKKERRKPWRKKERYAVLLLFCGTAILSFVLALVARRGKLPGLPKLDSAGLGLSETVVLTKNQVPDSRAEKQKQIISEFKDVTSKLSGVYALAVVDLSTGDTFGVNQFETMQAASLMKLPVMSLLLKNASEGKVNLDTVYALRSSDKIGGSGSLYSKPNGTEYKYKELLEYMGKQSDNTAFNVIRHKLTDEAVSDFMQKVGMTHTNIKQNSTTPTDMALLLRKLYEGRVIPVAYRDMLFNSITDTIYEDHLVAGLPENIRVSHKYGREVHVVNDAGVVFAPKPYVVVIMTDGVVESEADKIFPKLSEIVYSGEAR